MGLFNTNKLTKEDYETLSKRITDINNSILTLSKRLDGLELENSDLRNKVLRKIQIPKEEQNDDIKNAKVFKPGSAYY